MQGKRRLRAALLVAGLTLSASVALADATVLVELKGPDGSAADGTVQLSQGDKILRCTTSQGRCEIRSVPGGAYTVSVEQSGKPAGKPKSVMIPPQGEVKLVVAAKP